MFSLIAASLIASLAPQALGALYITSPVASTSCVGGQQCQAAWNDDGKTPTLGDLGVMNVGIFVGSVTSQVLIQDLGSIDVSKTSNTPFVAAPQIGPNGDMYFLRFTSLAFKDPSNQQYPAQGFSAKFALSGMSGNFNATVSSLIAGGTGAAPSATGAPTGSPATTTSNGAQTPTNKPSTSSVARTSGTPSSTPGAASPRAIIGGGSLVAFATVVVTALAAGLSL